MDRFKFRLDKVKSFREKLKKDSERILAQKMSVLTNAEQIMEQLKEEKDRQKADSDSILTAAQLSLIGDYEMFIQVLLEKQKGTIQEAEKAVEIAREDLIEKSRDEKALSLLKEKKQEEYKEEKKRLDRKETSELAIRQFNRGLDGSKK